MKQEPSVSETNECFDCARKSISQEPLQSTHGLIAGPLRQVRDGTSAIQAWLDGMEFTESLCPE